MLIVVIVTVFVVGCVMPAPADLQSNLTPALLLR
jgi:hypothetical protein